MRETRKGRAKQERNSGQKCFLLSEFYNASLLHFGFNALENLTISEVSWRVDLQIFFLRVW